MHDADTHNTIAIIGGGPTGLMAADYLASAGYRVGLYERMPSVGRKFLMAGRGGLNLTHSEELHKFLSRYRPANADLKRSIEAFPPSALRRWADDLGADTFAGTSGRIFPKAMKASPLLRAWLRRLDALGVKIHTRTSWLGWTDDGALSIQNPDKSLSALYPAATLLALGGASWPRLGADGAWTTILQRRNLDIAPLRPANCGFFIDWSPIFRDRFAGQPLKPARFSFRGKSLKSEAIITRHGIEGSAVYALSGDLRDAIDHDGCADLHIDLAPDMTLHVLTERLAKSRKGESIANRLRKTARLTPLASAILREAPSGPALPKDAETLARRIKNTRLRLMRAMDLERAISTAGGLRFAALDAHFMIRAMPGVFVAGEMLDWEAPTGGYLLQACFSTAIAAACGMTHWLEAHPPTQKKAPIRQGI